jgi:hypothetical protein
MPGGKMLNRKDILPSRGRHHCSGGRTSIRLAANYNLTEPTMMSSFVLQCWTGLLGLHYRRSAQLLVRPPV